MHKFGYLDKSVSFVTYLEILTNPTFMKYFFSRVFMAALLLSVVSTTDAKAVSLSVSEESDSTENSAKGGKSKDSQNQTEFMKPDMESQDYNFYDRKKISTPLMPRYDLDSAVYQKGFKKKEEQQKAFVQNKYRYPSERSMGNKPAGRIISDLRRYQAKLGSRLGWWNICQKGSQLLLFPAFVLYLLTDQKSGP